jgi:putative membrane protein
MLIKREQIAILIFNICFLAFFTVLFTSRKNYEFLMYTGVIIFFLFIIIATNRKVNYPNSVLWGLTLWAILHMSGGGIYIRGIKLYEVILLPISKSYNIFRYDQFVHIIGFGVATLVMYYMLRPLFPPEIKKWTAISIVIVMAGLGVGALNEIVEFLATVILPETGVGGYINTSLDLVADLIGSILALGFIRIKENK